MPFAFAFLGILLVVSGTRNTQDDLFKLVKSDFTGKNNFVYWILALFSVGALGYIPKLKPLSNALLLLVLLVLFLSHKGFFAQFMAEIKSTTDSAPANNTSNSSPINTPAPGSSANPYGYLNVVPFL